MTLHEIYWNGTGMQFTCIRVAQRVHTISHIGFDVPNEKMTSNLTNW